MTLEAGEVLCSKCKGSGKYFISHDHTLPAHNHNYPQHNHNVSSYAAETVCSKCLGAGKVDWITNAMGEQSNKLFTTGSHTHTLQPADNNVSFYHEETKMLEISKDGFYIEGRKVNDDKKIYDRFNKFLKKAGF